MRKERKKHWEITWRIKQQSFDWCDKLKYIWYILLLTRLHKHAKRNVNVFLTSLLSSRFSWSKCCCCSCGDRSWWKRFKLFSYSVLSNNHANACSLNGKIMRQINRNTPALVGQKVSEIPASWSVSSSAHKGKERRYSYYVAEKLLLWGYLEQAFRDNY